MKNKKKYNFYTVKNQKLILKSILLPPNILENQLFIKVNFCGVCGSDISMIKFGSQRINDQTVLGHEIVGTIVKVGNNLKNKNILGSRYCFGADIKNNCLNLNLQKCVYCNSGNPNLCICPSAISKKLTVVLQSL